MSTRFYCNFLLRGRTQKDSLWKRLWLEKCQWKVAILFGCYSKILKKEICAAQTGKEDHVKHQHRKPMWSIWSAGKEDRVKCQLRKKTMWSASRERRLCEVPAGKEDHVKCQKGKKTMWSASRERRPCEVPAGKEDWEAPAEQEDHVELASCLFVCFSSHFLQPRETT